jgi:NADPH:quinone reductase-like Zn-dependent oxidoreductase
MRRVVFEHIGEPDVLQTVENHLGPPRENEVQIKVRVIGLNRFETQFRRDSYAIRPVLPSGIGAEGVGVIEALGPGVDGHQVGDRVTVMPIAPCVGSGLYADVANVPVASLVPSLKGSSDEQEAAFWCAYLTAYELLTAFPIPAASFVLVTAAASSVGLALLQMIRDLGHTSIATTRSPAKAETLLALGASHVIITDQERISDGVARVTGGAGVALAADALAGEFLPDIVAATAAGGAVRVYGSLSEASMRETVISLPMFSLYRKTIGFATFNAVRLDPERFRAAQRYLRDGFERGALTPQIDRVFSLADIVEAHRYLEKGGQIGKVLCTP